MDTPAVYNGYELLIRDDTDGDNFARCPGYLSECSGFRGSRGADRTHVFRGYIATVDSSGNLYNVLAQSAPLSMNWRPFAITLSRQFGKDGAQVTATVHQNTVDSGMSLLIYDTTTGAMVNSCGIGAFTCAFTAPSLPDSYQAFVAPFNSATAPPFPPPGAIAHSDDGPLVAFGPTPANSLGGPTGICQKCNQKQAHDPVNTATGVFWDAPTDLAVPGRGPAFKWQRDYSTAMNTVGGPLGYGWTSSYLMKTRTAAGAVTVVQENGSEVTFQPNGSGGYTAPTNVLATLAPVGCSPSRTATARRPPSATPPGC